MRVQSVQSSNRAAAGRESSDQASVRGDAAADLGGAGPSELTVSEFSEERWRRKSNTYGEVSEKCSRTEAFPVDSTPGRESAFGFRVPDGQRRTNSPVPARAV